jgi:ribosomal-protein-alanine N-acetyltransferase
VDETGITINDCSSSDLAEVQRIENASFKHPFSQDLFNELLRRSPQGFRILRLNKQIIGYYIVTRSEAQSSVLIVASIAIHPSQRRRGMGSVLMKDIMSNTISRFPNATSIELEVATDNAAARNLYAKFGFEKRGFIRNYYGVGEDAFVMSRSF